VLPQQQNLVDCTNEHVFMWKIPEIGGRQSMMFNYIYLWSVFNRMVPCNTYKMIIDTLKKNSFHLSCKFQAYVLLPSIWIFEEKNVQGWN
jgi:hypothetical protein